MPGIFAKAKELLFVSVWEYKLKAFGETETFLKEKKHKKETCVS